VGDALVIGQSSGKIRAMFDYQGKPIKRAGPSSPVVVIGLHEVPQAGDSFEAMDSEREARDLAAERTTEAAERIGQAAGAAQGALTLEDLYARAQAGSVQALNLILKADVQGSLEPIKNSLEKIEIGDLKVRFIHQGVGNVAESDIMLAVASQAIIIGFNVDADAAAQRLAEAEGIEVRTYNVIYRIIEDVQLALTGMLQPVYTDVLQGQAVVRQVFRLSKHGSIAGVQVSEGKALRSATARVKRGGQQVGEGRVSSLKRFTEDVREVNTGLECGVGIDGFGNFEPDDIIEFYTRELVK
jgi:translation initiation factor IF-2